MSRHLLSSLGATNRLDHGYDAADNRTSVMYPGGTTVSCTYDALSLAGGARPR